MALGRYRLISRTKLVLPTALIVVGTPAPAATAQSGCASNDALVTLGITPKTLCVAGATSSDTSTLLLAVESSPELIAYVQARAALSSATQDHTDAMESARDRSEHEDSTEALDIAHSALSAAQLAHSAAKAELLALAMRHLPEQVATSLDRVLLNTGRGIPAAYACLPLSEDESRSLLLAIRTFGSETAPAWASDVMSDYDSRIEVLNAQSRITSTLPAIAIALECD